MKIKDSKREIGEKMTLEIGAVKKEVSEIKMSMGIIMDILKDI